MLEHNLTHEFTDSFGKVRQVRKWSLPDAPGGGRTLDAVDVDGAPAWGRKITVGPVAPENPQVGDLWINTSP